MALVGTVWLYTAAFNIDLQVNHIMGAKNTDADILSRWSIYELATETCCPLQLLCPGSAVSFRDIYNQLYASLG